MIIKMFLLAILVLWRIQLCICFNFKYYIFWITAKYVEHVWIIYSGFPHSSSSRRWINRAIYFSGQLVSVCLWRLHSVSSPRAIPALLAVAGRWTSRLCPPHSVHVETASRARVHRHPQRHWSGPRLTCPPCCKPTDPRLQKKFCYMSNQSTLRDEVKVDTS